MKDVTVDSTRSGRNVLKSYDEERQRRHTRSGSYITGGYKSLLRFGIRILRSTPHLISPRDGIDLQLRLDAFSVFNRPQFSNPSASISSAATVGNLTSASGNRTVQIGAKLQF